VRTGYEIDCAHEVTLLCLAPYSACCVVGSLLVHMGRSYKSS